MKITQILAIIALCALVLAGCGGPAAEWHPDKDGVGAWFDAGSQRLAVLSKVEGVDDGFELSIVSLDPKENRVSYNGFRLSGADQYTGDLDDKIKIAIKGAELTYTGLYQDGRTFTATYRGVDRAFLEGKLGESKKAFAAFAAQDDLGIMDEQRKGVLEMIIIPNLERIKLPR